MKKFIATIALLASAVSFAGETTVVWVRGNSSASVESQMRSKVREINSRNHMHINGMSCQSPKVYAASAPKKSFRVNRFGELETQWTATIKVSCR